VVELSKTIRSALAQFIAIAVCATIIAAPVHANRPACSPQDQTVSAAELFATDNTAVITDDDDGRLRDPLQLFEIQVDTTIAQAGAASTTG
jgi:hypothetical protein